jgi:hypothetical protein
MERERPGKLLAMHADSVEKKGRFTCLNRPGRKNTPTAASGKYLKSIPIKPVWFIYFTA